MTDLTDRLRATGIEACVRYTTEQVHLPIWRKSEPTYVAEILDAADACIAALLDELERLKDEYKEVVGVLDGHCEKCAVPYLRHVEEMG